MVSKKVRDKIRVNINISPKLKEYFEELSEEMGCSQSALMCLALNEYMEGKTVIKEIPSLMQLISQENKKKEIGCSCYVCGVKVPSSEHFISADGRILCDYCSVGVEPCSDDIRNKLLEYAKK